MSVSKIFILCVLAAGLTPLHSRALKVSTDSMKNISHISADAEAGYFYYDQTRSNIVLLPSILSVRRLYQKNVQNAWGIGQNANHQNSLSDNPFIHGAGYLTAHIRYDVNKRFEILGSVTGELRGTSYGVYNTGNTIVFPQFRLRYHDTIRVFQRPVFFLAAIGNFNNIRADEGMTYYNIDAEALHFKVSYAGFTYEHMHIADLVLSLGLNIDDGVINSLYYTTPKNARKQYFRFGIGFDENRQVNPDRQRPFLNAFAACIPDSGARLYVELSSIATGPFSSLNDFAALAGAKKKILRKNIRLWACAEIRYYGNYFKNNFWNDNVYYRNLNGGIYPAYYGNSIGPSLYPLRNYLLPFSQFAVFTEHQLNPFSVFGSTLTFYGDLRLYKKIFLNLDIDINYLTWFDPGTRLADIGSSASFTYPFYKAGLMFQPARLTRIFAGITNKGLNLDNTYQTFYLLKYPYFFISITKSVKGFL